MLDIRDDGLAELGDLTPGNGVREGHAPAFNITSVVDFPTPGTGAGSRTSHDRGDVHRALLPEPGRLPDRLAFDLDANGLPKRIPGNTYAARFGCNIPRSAVTESAPASWTSARRPRRPCTGTGCSASTRRSSPRNIRQLGTENNMITCATDFIGMADEDVFPEAVPALQDLSKFAPLPDRLQQGFLDFVYLGRLLSMPDGFASSPAFRFNGGLGARPVERLLLRQQPGRDRGRRADRDRAGRHPLGAVRAGNELRRPPAHRSVDFEDYSLVLYPSYPDEGERPLLLSMIQSLWTAASRTATPTT